MNNPSNIKKKSATLFWLLIWTDGTFLVVGNWQSSIVHFAASFQGRIGRPVSTPVITQPKMSSCLSKRSWEIVTLLCFCSSVSSFGTIFAHTFLMSRSSVKIFLTFFLSVFTCCSMLLTVSRRFSHTIWRIMAILVQAGNISSVPQPPYPP